MKDKFIFPRTGHNEDIFFYAPNKKLNRFDAKLDCFGFYFDSIELDQDNFENFGSVYFFYKGLNVGKITINSCDFDPVNDLVTFDRFMRWYRFHHKMSKSY